MHVFPSDFANAIAIILFVAVSGLQEDMGGFCLSTFSRHCSLSSRIFVQLEQRREDRRAGKDVA